MVVNGDHYVAQANGETLRYRPGQFYNATDSDIANHPDRLQPVNDGDLRLQKELESARATAGLNVKDAPEDGDGPGVVPQVSTEPEKPAEDSAETAEVIDIRTPQQKAADTRAAKKAAEESAAKEG